jgi:hypothetical protein
VSRGRSGREQRVDEDLGRVGRIPKRINGYRHGSDLSPGPRVGEPEGEPPARRVAEGERDDGRHPWSPALQMAIDRYAARSQGAGEGVAQGIMPRHEHMIGPHRERSPRVGRGARAEER